ncbi:MAG TPA: 2Fe-2S iron-sulfur cluster binding domain-containing protein [Aliiroseovarius sp.]|nr:2Fe-2S iron-sulfur cluster binding domain-containing protein [Aliiroseovarius sp.]
MDNRLGFTLNGRAVTTSVATGERLSHTLRERLGARDVKVGCNAGDCGACTVLVDGAPVCACVTPAHQAVGTRVETLKGLIAGEPLTRDLAARFQDKAAAQCGICTPGMLVSATALLRANPAPGQAEVEEALAGVLCRCTGYAKIIDAVMGRGTATGIAVGGVGDPVMKLDGAAKVEGREVFSDDVAPPDTLEIRLIRAPFARAAFRFGDLEAYAVRAGLTAILTARDVPGRNRFGVIPGFEDQPVFAERETRMRGEAVAAIIAPPEVLARLDLADFPVEWQALAPVEDLDAALAEGAPRLHADHPGNVMCEGFVARGDLAQGQEAAAEVVHGQFETSFVEHAYIEPEAGYARMGDDGRLEIHAGTQAPIMDREALAAILGLEEEAIRVIPTATGGGFGSKLDLSLQPYLALGVLATGQPVRLTWSRAESLQVTTKRHPARMQLRIAADANGRVTAMDFAGDFNTGAYASWGPTVANRVPVHASGPYRIGAYRARARGIYTNAPPSGAFRGFGVPQAAFAQESLFDELADRLGMDALEFRLINALDNGVPTVCGQVFDQGVGIRACLEALAPDWRSWRAAAGAFNANSDRIRRGVGLAAGWYGCGNTSLPNPSTIRAGIRADGALFLHQGAVDIGQGANTVIAQIFSEALGVPLRSVRLIGADTARTPDAGKTSASRQTFVTGNAAKAAGEALRATILRRANMGEGARITLGQGWIDVTEGDKAHRLELDGLEPDAQGYVLAAEESYDPPTAPLDESGQGIPYAQFGYAAQMAEVEVDMDLGTTRVLRMLAAHDVGRAINPLLVEGQVEGGIAQGLGMALMEEYVPGRTENLHDYLIPTIGDVPPITTRIIEEPDAHGPYGAKGLGEHALVPTAPAIANAIAHAAGVRPRRLPITPPRLRALIREARDG